MSAAARAKLHYPRTLPPKEARDFRRVPLPRRLARRPRDARGFVIPYSVDDGTLSPDFRFTKLDRVRELLVSQACWLCGEKRTPYMCFIGGPLSIHNRLFTDGWMHEGCAAYALRVCPFLSRPNGTYSKRETGRRLRVLPVMSTTRPEKFGMAYTRSFTTVMDSERNLYMRAGLWRRVHWFSTYGKLLAITTGSWEQSYQTEWKRQKLEQRRQDGSYEAWRAKQNEYQRRYRAQQRARRRAQEAREIS